MLRSQGGGLGGGVLDEAKGQPGAEALVRQGAALRAEGRFEEAEAACRSVLAFDPAHAIALRILGGMLMLQGRYADALALADAAISQNPRCGAAWITRGDALANAGRPDQALVAYREALADIASAPEAWLRTGKMHRVLGDPDAALAAFESAAALTPGTADPLYERALLRLQQRDFARGWADYEARWGAQAFQGARGQTPPQLAPLLKTGVTAADLAGQRVLLLGEQGIGDQVMFAGMIPDLLRAAASVVCVCEPRLIALFSHSFPEASFLHPAQAKIDSNAIDMLLAMGSLGGAFRRADADFPRTPYLRPTHAAVSSWAAKLGPRRSRLRLGLAWRGGVPQTGRLARSIPLTSLAPLLDMAGCEFVSLQYGDVTAELEAVNAGREAPVRSFPTEALHDFDSLAGLVANLDGVISVQTACVHLAGALGARCIVMAPHTAEWRYMRKGPDLPWYGSVRVLRQPAPGEWGEVIAQAARNLDFFEPGGSAPGAPKPDLPPGGHGC